MTSELLIVKGISDLISSMLYNVVEAVCGDCA